MENKKEFNQKLDSFLASVKKATKKAANKTMELADAASLNLKLQGLNVKLSEKFEQLGRLSYKKLEGIGEISTDECGDAPADDTVDKIASTVEEINKLYEQISCLKAEIKAQKESRKASKNDEE
jgi:flagellar hook-associated protein FlgK